VYWFLFGFADISKILPISKIAAKLIPSRAQTGDRTKVTIGFAFNVGIKRVSIVATDAPMATIQNPHDAMKYLPSMAHVKTPATNLNGFNNISSLLRKGLHPNEFFDLS